VDWTERPTVRIVNDFFHDVAAGLWPGAVLALWSVHQNITRTTPAALVSARGAIASAIWVLFLAVIILVVTGTLRISYWDAPIRPESRSAKQRMILIKHAAFVTLLVASSLFAWLTLR
jgi:putative copper export protein